MGYRFNVELPKDHPLNKAKSPLKRRYSFVNLNVALHTATEFRQAGAIVEVPTDTDQLWEGPEALADFWRQANDAGK